MKIHSFYINQFKKKAERDVGLLRRAGHSVTMSLIESREGFFRMWSEINDAGCAVILNTHSNSMYFTPSEVKLRYNIGKRTYSHELADAVASVDIAETDRDNKSVYLNANRNVLMVLLMCCNAGRNIKELNLAWAFKNIIHPSGITVASNVEVHGSDSNESYYCLNDGGVNKEFGFFVYSGRNSRTFLFSEVADISLFFAESLTTRFLTPSVPLPPLAHNAPPPRRPAAVRRYVSRRPRCNLVH